MIQFYFLSVLFNLVGGYALVEDSARNRHASLEGLRTFLRDPTVRLVIGILSAVVGAFKLLTVVRGDIPVVGDFLPAVAGIAVGATLLLDIYRSPSADAEGAAIKSEGAPEGDAGDADDDGAAPQAGRAESSKAGGSEAKGKARGPGRLETFLREHEEAVGMAGMIAALVHFLFPAVLFL